MVPVPSLAKVAGKPLAEVADEATIERLVQRTRDGGAEIVALLKTGNNNAASSAIVEITASNSSKVKPRHLLGGHERAMICLNRKCLTYYIERE